VWLLVAGLLFAIVRTWFLAFGRRKRKDESK
jgi:hypothetical protein